MEAVTILGMGVPTVLATVPKLASYWKPQRWPTRPILPVYLLETYQSTLVLPRHEHKDVRSVINIVQLPLSLHNFRLVRPIPIRKLAPESSWNGHLSSMGGSLYA